MGDMVVLRDPNGFRPLCYAQDGPLFAAASESVPLLEPRLPRRPFAGAGRDDPHPGQRDPPATASPRRQTPSHCFFEWIYFANVASTLDDRSVYLTRAALGKELARQERQLDKVPLDDDTIVVPVPDTGKAAADAMAFELGLPSVEGLIRNRYIGRTFIEGQNRAERVQLKYTPLREVLDGKRVLLIEDTIVRSTTMKIAAARPARARRGQGGPRPRRLPADRRAVLLRHRHVHGARAVRAAVHEGRPASPTRSRRRWPHELGADSLFYLPLEAVARCIGLDAEPPLPRLPDRQVSRRRPASGCTSCRCATATAPSTAALTSWRPRRHTRDSGERRGVSPPVNLHGRAHAGRSPQLLDPDSPPL